MFLDDQIVKTVLERNPKNRAEELSLFRNLLELCHSRMSENLLDNPHDDNIVPATKKVCNAWDSACRILKKKDCLLLAEGGFKKYILTTQLREMLVKLGFTD